MFCELEQVYIRGTLLWELTRLRTLRVDEEPWLLWRRFWAVFEGAMMPLKSSAR